MGVGTCVWPGARTNVFTTESGTPLMVKVFAPTIEVCAAAAAPLPGKYTLAVMATAVSSRRCPLVVIVIKPGSTPKN